MMSISLFTHKLVHSADSRYGSWKLLHLLKVNNSHQCLFLIYFFSFKWQGKVNKMVISIEATTLDSTGVQITHFPLSNYSHQWMLHGKIQEINQI